MYMYTTALSIKTPVPGLLATVLYKLHVLTTSSHESDVRKECLPDYQT